MEMTEIKEIILSWDEMLSKRMKKYIHYRSMKNFVLHYDEIKSDVAKEKICFLLSDYIDEVRASDYSYEGESSFQLARNYLSKISEYYREYSNFTGLLKVKVILLFGIMGDSLLYLTRIPSILRHIPIVTIGLFLYYLFIIIFKEPKGRVYGIFY